MESSPAWVFSAEEQILLGCLATQAGLGYVGLSRLLSAFSLPGNIYKTGERDLLAASPGLSVVQVKAIRRGPDAGAWQSLLQRCRRLGQRLLVLGSPEYPRSIAALRAPPPLLFAQGEAGFPDESQSVAMVGTRRPTEYGRRAAYTLARDLAQAGVTIISGMAAGIDAAAHAGALDGAGQTLAVVGCGLDILYPPENADLRQRLLSRGALLSEFAPGTPPRRGHFPRRNRLLSALARAVIVVEAGTRSGALITAAFARDQGKALFAVPGSIFNPAAAGAHALLRRGARPAASASEVLQAWGENNPRSVEKAGDLRRTLTTSDRDAKGQGQHPVLSLWRGEEVCALDALEERAQSAGRELQMRGMGSLLHALLQLEMQGLIERLPGSFYRNKSAL